MMSLAYLEFDRWLFVKRSNPRFKEKAITKKAKLGISEIWLEFKQVFFWIKRKAALPGVAQWIEYQPAKQRVTSSIPSQGTCLGCKPGPQ